MQCESCQKREATIEFTTVAGDEKKTAHLCAECAAERSQQQAARDDAPDSKLKPTATGKKKVNVVVGHLAKSEAKTSACPDCGMTYDEFRKVGRLGCSGCYTAFAKPLLRLLKRIHGADRHVGRGPGTTGEDEASTQNDVQRLRMELAQAVEDEAYERAAELRDQITQMESKDA